MIRHDPEKLQEIRRRLSDFSWGMRLLCQRIAQRANAEDHEQGKFWQARGVHPRAEQPQPGGSSTPRHRRGRAIQAA